MAAEPIRRERMCPDWRGDDASWSLPVSIVYVTGLSTVTMRIPWKGFSRHRHLPLHWRQRERTEQDATDLNASALTNARLNAAGEALRWPGVLTQRV